MREIGALGEKLVSRWLELENYHLLEQNWRCRWGEIDIVAQDEVSKAIAFVEVKTRSSNNWDENGMLAVNLTKQEKIIQTAYCFLARYPQLSELPCRFDVAAVSCKKYLAQKHENKIKNLTEISQLTIGQTVILQQYQLTIKNYLKSAFET